MSKLSFRARALDPSKPMPIYLAEELPDLPEYSAINRAVPQMPSGMEKEEESVSFFGWKKYFYVAVAITKKNEVSAILKMFIFLFQNVKPSNGASFNNNIFVY